jgi:hypothetical protein
MGRVAEWLKATDCKFVEVFYVGFAHEGRWHNKKKDWHKRIVKSSPFSKKVLSSPLQLHFESML